uniref:protein-serine/threonine phosphatase n=1 Tax=Leersia perrieri TaxID=77586 RepID=A0A0D9V1Y6_9ORYZ
MEDEVVLRPGSLLDGFSFAAVFDGHAGFSAVQFLRHRSAPLPPLPLFIAIRHGRFSLTSPFCRCREELYKECAAALDGGAVLSTKNLEAITDSIQRAFATVDANLSTWLEQMDKEDESGATVTAMFLRNDVLVVSHIGDSCLVISRGGRPQVVTNFHRPYGNKKASLEEVKRIRAAGGWIVDGRICGEISVSRAFGDIRFKTRKNEITFKGDLIISSPEVSLVELGPDVEFILLATDGLWDYIKSSEAVALVRDQLRQHGDVQLACEALGQTALEDKLEGSACSKAKFIFGVNSSSCNSWGRLIRDLDFIAICVTIGLVCSFKGV